MRRWLLKTEPSEFSYDDLEGAGRATWDGVRNPQALANLRAMSPGDGALVYHTGAERAAVGSAEVRTGAYPDPAVNDPRLVVVEVTPRGRLPRPVSLAELRAEPVFAGSPLLRQGRLSVVPLTEEQWGRVLALGRAPAP